MGRSDSISAGSVDGAPTRIHVLLGPASLQLERGNVVLDDSVLQKHRHGALSILWETPFPPAIAELSGNREVISPYCDSIFRTLKRCHGLSVRGEESQKYFTAVL